MSQESQPGRTRKLLRPIKVVMATLSYCLGNVGRLVSFSWFPFLLTIATVLALQALLYAYPRMLPDWLINRGVAPSTWLTPVCVAPFFAMVWAYVLEEFFKRNFDRAVAGPNVIRVERLGIEVSRPVLLAALLLAVAGLYLGFVKLVRFYILYEIVVRFRSDADSGHFVFIWRMLSWPAYAFAAAVVQAPLYLLTGQVLISGRFAIRPLWSFVYQNWLRLCVIAIILGIVQWGVEWLALALEGEAHPFLLEWFGGLPRGWQDNLAGYVLQLPFSAPIFFVRAIMPAAAVAIVLKGRQALA